MKIYLDDDKLRRAVEALADRYHREVVPDLTEDEIHDIVEDNLPDLLEFLINDMLDDAQDPVRIDGWLEKELVDDLKWAVAKRAENKATATAATTAV